MSDFWDWLQRRGWVRLRRGFYRMRRRALLASLDLEGCVPDSILGVRLTAREVGLLGEALACRLARRLGGKVLYRNFRAAQGGELDLVLRYGDGLVFVEVKARRNAKGIRPWFAVDLAKRDLIRRAALQWRRMIAQPNVRLRFDVLEVILEPGQAPQMRWVRDAFAWDEPQGRRLSKTMRKPSVD